MAQVWIRRDGLVIELELFDLHRPNPAIPTIDGSDSQGGTRRRLADASSDVLRQALQGDDIWHFGLRVVDEAAVEHLHGRFLELVERDDRFRLRTGQTVANPWHGSVHTKLTNLEAEIEVEFLTYRVDWKARQQR